ncbi:unnamed protein product [Phytophthora lilii]|uniref:Unnamed protein product n=1 Tax=Phytophthora lilii TaxID=2077276 RepID=A0A9W6TWB3_9STRA|nr:unnamed protein product [Phytophthora lilii]
MAPRRYKAVLVEFMSFNDTQKYSEDTEFSERPLLRITPEAICRWMNMKTFGELSPADDDKPLHARSATLEFAKKAISAFMPRKTYTAVPDALAQEHVRGKRRPRASDVRQLDPRVRALLNFAVYMEMSPQLSGSEYVFGNPAAGPRVIRRFLQDVFSSDDFQAQRSGNLANFKPINCAAVRGDRLVNPVNRVGVYIVGDGAQLQMIGIVERVDSAANELLGNGDSATMHQTGASLSMATDSSRKKIAALQMQLFGLKRYLTGMTEEILRLRTEMQRENTKLLAVTRRIAAQPVVRSRPNNLANQNVPARSECSDQSGNQSGH